MESIPNIHVRSGLAIQELQFETTTGNTEKHCIITIVGVRDPLHETYDKSNATYLGLKWTTFLNQLGIKPSHIWENEDEPKTLWNARLFPVIDNCKKCIETDYLIWMQDLSQATENLVKMWLEFPRASLSDCTQLIDPLTEYYRRRRLWISVVLKNIVAKLEFGEITEEP
eukprot:UN27584